MWTIKATSNLNKYKYAIHIYWAKKHFRYRTNILLIHIQIVNKESLRKKNVYTKLIKIYIEKNKNKQ